MVKKKYTFEDANEEDQVGIVRGLAWTSVGGDTLQIEVKCDAGKKDELKLTAEMGGCHEGIRHDGTDLCPFHLSAV